MKKIFLFLFVSVLFISCDTTTKNQTDKDDPMSGYMVGNDEKSKMLWLNSLKHIKTIT